MSGILEYMQLCRLCLVKEKVNVPIFGEQNDVRQIFLKISACLPVKVSKDDNLPKNICDSCLYKVDLLYQFWNTTVTAEKQLLQWLGDVPTTVQHSILQDTLILKQEKHEPNDSHNIEDTPQNYLSSHSYGSYNQFVPNQNNSVPSAPNLSSSSNNVAAVTTTAKRRGRPPGSSKKESPPATTTSTNIKPITDEDSMDEDSNCNEPSQDESDDSMEETGNLIAKEEQESEDEYDNNEELEPTTFVGVPNETPCDTEQPGPSGLNINKPATITATEAGVSQRKRKTKRLNASGDKIQQARELVQNGKSKRHVAKLLGIPESTLRKRLKMNYNPISLGRKSTFTPEIEKEMLEYIEKLNNTYYGFTKKDLRVLAYDFAERNNMVHSFNKTTKMAGKDWLRGFLKRNPTICLRQPVIDIETLLRPEAN